MAQTVFVLLAIVLSVLPVSNALAAPFAYITNYQSATVSVIDTSSNSVAKTIPVGSGPVGVAVNPAGTLVYVTNSGSFNASCYYPYTGCGYTGGTVTVIDASTNSVVTTIAGVGHGPYAAAVNPAGTRLYVTNYGTTGSAPSTVSVIDTSANTVIAAVPVGNAPSGVVVSPDGTRVYVSNNQSQSISVIDATNNSVVKTISAGLASFPLTVALNPAGTRLYVSHYLYNNVVSVIDTATNSVINTIPVAGGTIGMAINPAGTRLYAAHTYYYATDQVSVVDLTQDRWVATVTVGGWPHGIAVNPSGTHIYVANAQSNSVSVIDADTNRVVTTVGVGGYPIAHGQFIGPGEPSCVEPRSGLVSWWSGDGNADDIRDSNEGTLQNGATFAPGKVGQAFNFDGVNDEVRVPYAANLNPTQALTLGAWVNASSLTNAANGGYLGIVSMSEGQRAYTLGFTGTGGNHVGTAGNVHLEGYGLGSAWRTSAAVISPGQWYHIAGVIEPSTNRFEIYVNGVLQTPVNSRGAPQLFSVSNVPFRIGSSDPGRWQYNFAGLIDEVEIYNRALSASEIQAIFLAGSAGKCKASTDTTPPTTTDNAPSAWQQSDFTVTLVCADNEGGSGCKETKYRVDGGVWQTGAAIPISTEGDHLIEYYSVDKAGNQESAKDIHAKLDKTPPTIGTTQTPAPNGLGWNNSPVTVTFTASDSTSDVATVSSPITVTAEGVEQLIGTATDQAGNSATLSVTVSIDRSPPTLNFGAPTPPANAAGWHNTDVSIPFTATDSLSGIAPTSAVSPLVLTAEGMAVTGSVTMTDKAGNSATFTSAAVKIDKAPPAIGAVSSITAEATSAAGAVVTYALPTATDAIDPAPVVTASPASGSPFPLGTTTVTVTARDAAGNSGTETFTVTVRDTIAPSVTVPGAIRTAATGPAGAAVSFSVTATDAVGVASGPTCAPASGSTFPIGTTSVACTAGDAAGNTGAATFSVTVYDPTPPAITPSVTGTLGSNGWYVSNVGVSWALSDPESAITSKVGCDPISLTAETPGTTVTCSATSAGGTALQSVTIKIDRTLPTVTYAGNAGTYTIDQTVAISCTAADALSGVASTTCAHINGPAYTFPLGTRTFSASATDQAGNIGHGSTSFTVVVTYESLHSLTRQFVGQRGILNSLEAKLNAAEAAAARGNAQAKAGALGAFINEVQAQTGKAISAQNAAILIALARAL